MRLLSDVYECRLLSDVYVDEARGVGKDRVRWRSVGMPTPMGIRMYESIIYRDLIFFLLSS